MSSTAGTGPENPPVDSSAKEVAEPSPSSMDEIKARMASKISETVDKQKKTPAQLSRVRNRLIPNKIYENSEYTRTFEPKMTYQPRDLSEMSVVKPSRRTQKVNSSRDPFVTLGINPLESYKNTNILANFVTDMGKIKPRYKTGLTAKTQRRLSKAIKRARAFGLMPVTTKPYFMYNYRSMDGRGSQY
ncbi:hypothetical protein LPJ56_000851 [Coemansia sp. RSA 2599]|nr:hypothetical protein LPJ56_000851 [Coemansia sp. RSA 2599]